VKNRVVLAAAATGLSCALAVALGAGVSGAAGGPANGKGHHGHSPAVMAGVTSCKVNNIQLRFSAPLTATATTAATTVTLTGNVLRGCDNAVQGAAHARNGHLSGLVASIPAGATCSAFLAATTSPAFAGGAVRWTPVPKIAATTGISFPAGTMSATTGGDLQLSLSAGTASGSYATTAAALTATSRDTLASLNATCATGLRSIGFAGTVTL